MVTAPAQTVSRVAERETSEVSLPLPTKLYRAWEPRLPSLHCLHLPGAHSETMRFWFKQTHRRIISSISWFPLFSWKSAWKHPCSRLPHRRLSQCFHDRQVTQDTHTRGLFMGGILFPLPTKIESNELFSKAGGLFQSVHFHESQCHPNAVMNSFWILTSQGYQLSFHRKT